MNSIDNSKIPHVLEFNRVKRAYIGGKLLDKWQGKDNPEDNNYPEEFLSSTVEVTNPDRYPQEGLSKTILPNGEIITLKDLIAEDYKAMLGDVYENKKDVCVSARVGDTTVRLVLQSHPDTAFANKYLNFPNGKSEAWYIIETREINGQKAVLYAGFKKGVTREKWYDLFLKQDIQGMLDCMHVIDVHKGGVYFVPAGMPHCLGPGSVFLEIHEPCDYTFRLEKNYLSTRKFSDYELHYGLGNDLLMDTFHYDTYTDEEIREICVLDNSLMFKTENATALEIVSYKQADRFKVEKYEFKGSVTIPKFDGHRIAITVKESTVFEVNEYEVKAPQGRAVFLPAGINNVTLKDASGENAIVLICYPPEMKNLPQKVFRNPIQVGVLTKDLEKYLKRLEETFGIGPWRISEYPPIGTNPFTEYMGEKGDFRAKFCFFNLGNIEIELIQPLSGNNIWDDFIEKHGNAIHHIKFLVDEHEPIKSYLYNKGYKIIQQGEGVGPNTGRVWAFYNTFDDIGFDVEIMNSIIG